MHEVCYDADLSVGTISLFLLSDVFGYVIFFIIEALTLLNKVWQWNTGIGAILYSSMLIKYMSRVDKAHSNVCRPVWLLDVKLIVIVIEHAFTTFLIFSPLFPILPTRDIVLASQRKHVVHSVNGMTHSNYKKRKVSCCCCCIWLYLLFHNIVFSVHTVKVASKHFLIDFAYYSICLSCCVYLLIAFLLGYWLAEITIRTVIFCGMKFNPMFYKRRQMQQLGYNLFE